MKDLNPGIGSPVNSKREESSTETRRNELELQRLRKEAEKLDLELEALRRQRWDRWTSIGSVILAVLAFLFGVHQFKVGVDQFNVKRKEDKDAAMLELRREVAMPFWETQMSLYIKASEAAATIATSNDEEARNTAEKNFWILYWGSLACVEDVTLKSNENFVETAMVKFGNALQNGPVDQETLQPLALNIAHAVRRQIAPAFELETASIIGEQKAPSSAKPTPKARPNGPNSQ